LVVVVLLLLIEELRSDSRGDESPAEDKLLMIRQKGLRQAGNVGHGRHTPEDFEQ
jgi:hypothetical protein